ncbi:hypothetical protein GCM10027448_42070 [Nocardioides dilutus]
MSRAQLTRLCQIGQLRQPIRRVYLATQVPDSILVRAQCLTLVMPDDCVIVDRHAGWLHGAEMTLAPGEHLNVLPLQLFRPSGRGRLRNGLTVSGERNLIPTDITEVQGLPVSTILRTAWDLGRVPSRQRSIAGIDQMMRLDGFPRGEFLAGIERFRGQRWVRNLRTLGPLATGKAESPGESALLLGWHDAGLPEPTPQVEFWEAGRLIARCDVGNEELGYMTEYLGFEWHSSDVQVGHDASRREYVEGRGNVVDEFTKEEVFGQHRNLESLLVRGSKLARIERERRRILLL